MALLDDAEPVAVDACLAGGRYLRGAYQDGTSEVTHSAVDAKSTADIGAEERMLAVLEESFPDHTVDAEESGRHPGDDRYRWIVDPLDGTTPVRIPARRRGRDAGAVTRGGDRYVGRRPRCQARRRRPCLLGGHRPRDRGRL